MPPTRPMLLDQPGGLQRLFEEAIGDGHAVLALRHLVKVPHIEPAIPLPIQTQQALPFPRRDSPDRRRGAALIDQPDIAMLLIPLTPAAETARGEPENV